MTSSNPPWVRWRQRWKAGRAGTQLSPLPSITSFLPLFLPSSLPSSIFLSFLPSSHFGLRFWLWGPFCRFTHLAHHTYITCHKKPHNNARFERGPNLCLNLPLDGHGHAYLELLRLLSTIILFTLLCKGKFHSFLFFVVFVSKSATPDESGAEPEAWRGRDRSVALHNATPDNFWRKTPPHSLAPPDEHSFCHIGSLWSFQVLLCYEQASRNGYSSLRYTKIDSVITNQLPKL